MKKIIIRESQFIKLKKIISENKTIDLKEFYKEVQNQFNDVISHLNIGDNLIFGSAEIERTKNGYKPKNFNVYTFIVTNLSNNQVTLHYVNTGQKKTQFGQTKYYLTPNSFRFKNEKPVVILKDENGKPREIDDFVSVESYDMQSVLNLDPDDELLKKVLNDIDKNVDQEKAADEERKLQNELERKSKENANKFEEEGFKKWLENVKHLRDEIIFKPGFLGMNNYFFYPTGIVAMNDILKKYGLGVSPKTTEKYHDEMANHFYIKLVKKTILDQDGKVVMDNTNAPNGFPVTYDKTNDTLIYKLSDDGHFYVKFKLTGGELLKHNTIHGAKYIVNNENGRVTGKVQIKIL